MNPKSLGQSLTGAIVLILGVGFLLDSLNIWNFGNIIGQWWPLILIALGIASLSSNRRQPIWPGFLIVAGLLFLLKSTNVYDFDVWQVIWPIGLILIGLSIVIGRVGSKPPADNSKLIDLFAAFSGAESRNTTKDFRGGRATALFGGIKLDLSEANIDKSATIDIFTAFGGVEIVVPDTWRVSASGLPIFGGWDDKTSHPDKSNAPVLEIRGSCLFGGVEIHN